MRLTEDQIVDLIGHPEKLVRQAALDYFTQAYKDHPRLWAEVRAAAEKYGGAELIAYWDWFPHLTPPEDQLPWLVKQAEVEGSEYADACRYLLFAQDARKLKWLESLWRDNANLGIGEDTAKWLSLRMSLVDASAEEAWRQLEAWAVACSQTPHDEESIVSWKADAITEAIRRGETAELRRRVTEIILEGESDPQKVNFYLIPWAIRLAGAWKISEVAEAIFRYDLTTQNAFASPEVGDALAKIGGEPAVRALTSAWSEWDQGVQTLAALYMAYQRGPAAIDAAIALVAETAPKPDSGDLLHLLGDCVLIHFDEEAGERLIQALGTDEATAVCAKSLIIWSVGLGLEHRDRGKWPALVKQRLEYLREHGQHTCGPGCDHDHGHEHHHHHHEHDQEGCGPGCDHDHGHHHHHADEPEDEIDHDSLTVRNEQTRVGRNDPCPCGSGKKYKKCCLLKVGSTADFDLDF